ncbi:MAG: transglutaminase family protein [Paludibaculum sp.]
MAIRVALHHRTVYHYDRLVRLSPQVIRLRPAPHCRTTVESYSLKISPREHFINWQQDPQSNYLARVVFPEPVRHFSIEVDLVADMTVINPFDFFLEPAAEHFPFVYEPSLAKELTPFLETLPAEPHLDAYVAAIDRSECHIIDFLVALNQRLQKEISYTIRLEPGVQTPEQTLDLRSGSCRDSAWLLVQVLRRLGLAARFVSGYLIQLKPDLKPLEGPEGPQDDFTDLHAWTEVYLPGAGWIGLDPTSGLFAGEGHLPVAASPDPFSAAPVTGGVDECKVEFTHEMSVRRIHEDPRVTLPYTEEQWSKIEALGHAIDSELNEGDVRLTMGGEPTFVSIDDMDGAEWNTEAQGQNKRRMSGELIKRFRDRFAPGGFLHFGQGKWYPGESLPRWALTCYWRNDGVPMWQDPSLIAAEDESHGYTEADAFDFTERLARRLGLDPDYVNAAFEDPLHYLQRERQLPVNVDPLDSRLENAEDRERIRRVFERGLTHPVGFVLPVQRGYGKSGPEWQTGLWLLRGQKLFLIPGDSPVGLRLPLPSLPWAAPADMPFLFPQDPLAPRNPLPVPERQYQGVQVPQQQKGDWRSNFSKPSDTGKEVKPGESAGWVVRTAICVEPRDGQLHVFMPPVTTLEDYIDLLAAIEDTAAQRGTPVIVEGTTPPSDPRIGQIRVTPDPGVIEVNTPPARNWDELVRNTIGIYEDARQSRLGTEKFMLDGRHTGTGGGNHVVLGGPTSADSPMLRRPDLLRSLIGYWLNHPSLSYLFSSLFIGPTSQAPRIDETRQDSLYELEIAYSQIPLPGQGHCPPWLVDRIFRHLLVDVTGNTHRAEFCIDKLYAPETSSGRLGLLEMRGFEMPPHSRMSLMQQLLIRALVARFWKQPYLAKPARWGTQLHDKFMLPYFLALDFEDVLEELRASGYAMDSSWFAPHFEFRFPAIGTAVHFGVEVELRQAGEPWYVLGEEPGGGGTARYVDSSVERLQVKVRGLFGDRHVVTCNGRRVPLAPTGTEGEFVAGVRYRAWQPPSCLHPTIPVHTPLIFDLLDLWSSRSIGGCTYHVAHPGGRNYVTFPVNAAEAESRRSARFFRFGHTPGPMQAPVQETNAQFPYTLDLRRSPYAR